MSFRLAASSASAPFSSNHFFVLPVFFILLLPSFLSSHLVSYGLHELFVIQRFFCEPCLRPIVLAALSLMLSWNNFHCSVKSLACCNAANLLLTSMRKLFAISGSFYFSVGNGRADVTACDLLFSLSQIRATTKLWSEPTSAPLNVQTSCRDDLHRLLMQM